MAGRDSVKPAKHRLPWSARGVSPAIVGKWLRRYESEGIGVAKTGLPGRTRRTRITSEQTRMIETVRARQPFRKIARAAGLSLGPVARIAKANGAAPPLRPRLNDQDRRR
jgi:transposase